MADHVIEEENLNTVETQFSSIQEKSSDVSSAYATKIALALEVLSEESLQKPSSKYFSEGLPK